MAIRRSPSVDLPPDTIVADSLDGLRAASEAMPRKRTRFALGEGAADLSERVEVTRGVEVSATA